MKTWQVVHTVLSANIMHRVVYHPVYDPLQPQYISFRRAFQARFLNLHTAWLHTSNLHLITYKLAYTHHQPGPNTMYQTFWIVVPRGLRGHHSGLQKHPHQYHSCLTLIVADALLNYLNKTTDHASNVNTKSAKYCITTRLNRKRTQAFHWGGLVHVYRVIHPGELQIKSAWGEGRKGPPFPIPFQTVGAVY